MKSLLMWDRMFGRLLEKSRAILEDGCYHTVLSQRYCTKGNLSALPMLVLAEMSVTWLLVEAVTGSRFVGKAAWPSIEVNRKKFAIGGS